KYLSERRAADPSFAYAKKDGIHPDSLGHWIMAKAVLNYLGEKEDAESAGAAFEKYPEVFKLVAKKQRIMKDSWLTKAGHKRPGMYKGVSLRKAKRKETRINKKIMQALR